MDVSVLEATEMKIREIARTRGQGVAEFAGALLDEKVSELIVEEPKKKTLDDLTGIFYGGPGDTSERASEILRAEMGLSSLGRD